jgi:hypothetical protein
VIRFAECLVTEVDTAGEGGDGHDAIIRHPLPASKPGGIPSPV